MEQFGVQFYQASLTARDVDKLVRFEVLSYGEKKHPPVAGPKGPRQVEGELGSARTPHRRQREGLSAPDHQEEDRRARAVLRAVPRGAQSSVDSRRRHHLVATSRSSSSRPARMARTSASLKVPEREGILRAIDGQHRLLALHSDIEQFGHDEFTVPAVIFDRLPEDHVVQMFVTINAKHTRLNPSHLVSLSGRQLYRDPNLAAAHDVVRALNDREDSPLDGADQAARRRHRQRRAGAARAGAEVAVRGGCVRRTAQERGLPRGRAPVLRQLLQADLARCSTRRGTGRKYSIKTAPALRAFIRVAPDVVKRLDQEHADRTDFRAIGRVIAPWGRRIGDAALRDRRGVEAQRRRRSISSRRSCGSRCSIRKARSRPTTENRHHDGNFRDRSRPPVR